MTRAEYMRAGRGVEDPAEFRRVRGEAHERYYGQFVGVEVKRRVLRVIGRERLLASEDENLNDIPLRLWDAVFTPGYPASIGDTFRAAETFATTASLCCIAKAAAREIIKEEK